jgi:hypothetical protein
MKYKKWRKWYFSPFLFNITYISQWTPNVHINYFMFDCTLYRLFVLNMCWKRDSLQIMIFVCFLAPRKCPYSDVVVGLARSYDPKMYTGGNVLLVGSPMPESSKLVTPTNRDTLALRVGGR